VPGTFHAGGKPAKPAILRRAGFRGKSEEQSRWLKPLYAYIAAIKT
jgi:hypothetical protein